MQPINGADWNVEGCFSFKMADWKLLKIALDNVPKLPPELLTTRTRIMAEILAHQIQEYVIKPGPEKCGR